MTMLSAAKAPLLADRDAIWAQLRQEARAALALEAHIRLTCDILTRHAGAATGGRI